MSRDPRIEDMEHSEKVLAKRAEVARLYKEKVRCFIKKNGEWEEGNAHHLQILTEWHRKDGKPSGSIYHYEHNNIKIDMMFSSYKTIEYINRVSREIR
jgi:hypothetical protein